MNQPPPPKSRAPYLSPEQASEWEAHQRPLFGDTPAEVPLALVLGSGRCADGEVEALDSVGEDCERLSQALVRHSGVEEQNLWVLPEADFAAVRAALGAVIRRSREVRRAGGHVALWFYFAGHGMREEEDHYLVLADTRPRDLLGTGMATGYLLKELQDVEPERSVIVLDCCHAGAALWTARDRRVLQLAWANRFAGLGRDFLILLAAAAGREAYERDGRAFLTGALVEYLEGAAASPGQRSITDQGAREYIIERTWRLASQADRWQEPAAILHRQSPGPFVLARNPGWSAFFERAGRKLTTLAPGGSATRPLSAGSHRFLAGLLRAPGDLPEEAARLLADLEALDMLSDAAIETLDARAEAAAGRFDPLRQARRMDTDSMRASWRPLCGVIGHPGGMPVEGVEVTPFEVMERPLAWRDLAGFARSPFFEPAEGVDASPGGDWMESVWTGPGLIWRRSHPPARRWPGFDPESSRPAVGLHLFEAMAFCNWLALQDCEGGGVLSPREGLPYVEGGMNPAAGWRLPTGAEAYLLFWLPDAAPGLVPAPGSELVFEQFLDFERARRPAWTTRWADPVIPPADAATAVAGGMGGTPRFMRVPLDLTEAGCHVRLVRSCIDTSSRPSLPGGTWR